MSKQRIIFLSGLVIALMQFSGFPDRMRNILYIIFGLLIMYVSYRIHKEVSRLKLKKENTVSSHTSVNKKELNLSAQTHDMSSQSESNLISDEGQEI